ncbi:CoA transferase [Pseudoteredinibacter isoporae]|uniref:CoA transferase n=1 Tax=Pseudoteredinibacter isoporae TaxID=570281 RepID=UPI0031075A43
MDKGSSQSDSMRALQALFELFGLNTDELTRVDLGSQSPLLSSAFKVSNAAQVSIAASALMADRVYRQRLVVQDKESPVAPPTVHTVKVPLNAAEAECTAMFTLNGRAPETWAKYSGVYRCRDGYIRAHANFDHHRDAFLRLIGCDEGAFLPREHIEQRVLECSAAELEELAVDAGAIIAKMRSPEEWAEHPQAKAMAQLPVLEIEKINACEPVPLPSAGINKRARPLDDIRVLDLTRILAGPVCTRTLAAYGASVLTVNSPNLPNIEHIIDTGRGKRSCHLDFQLKEDKETFKQLLSSTDVFVQSYRPGSLAQLGLDADSLAAIKPGLVYCELSAFGHLGPWSNKRGFDSIVQTASGLNWVEAEAYRLAQANEENEKLAEITPRAFPVQILDFATGFLMAFGSQLALLKRAEEGGSWRVRCSLLQTANWLRGLGQRPFPIHDVSTSVDFSTFLKPYPSHYGHLMAMPHAAEFSNTFVDFKQASAKPGTHRAIWDE